MATAQRQLKKLGRRNYDLISRGVNTMGSYDPNEILFLFEEELYTDEYTTIVSFLRWVHADSANRGFGSGNYEERFSQYRASEGK